MDDSHAAMVPRRLHNTLTVAVAQGRMKTRSWPGRLATTPLSDSPQRACLPSNGRYRLKAHGPTITALWTQFLWRSPLSKNNVQGGACRIQSLCLGSVVPTSNSRFPAAPFRPSFWEGEVWWGLAIPQQALNGCPVTLQAAPSTRRYSSAPFLDGHWHQSQASPAESQAATGNGQGEKSTQYHAAVVPSRTYIHTAFPLPLVFFLLTSCFLQPHT